MKCDFELQDNFETGMIAIGLILFSPIWVPLAAMTLLATGLGWAINKVAK